MESRPGRTSYLRRDQSTPPARAADATRSKTGQTDSQLEAGFAALLWLSDSVPGALVPDGRMTRLVLLAVGIMRVAVRRTGIEVDTGAGTVIV